MVGKTGAQASFRISSVRQELQIDIRPQIGKIKQFAEYLQAEAEELLLTTAIKAASTSGTTGTGTATSGRSIGSADRSGGPVEVLEVYQGSDQICRGRKGSGGDRGVGTGGVAGWRTHALLQARPHERDNLTAVEVELACGSTVLYKHAGTSAILTLEPVDAGCVVRWNAKGCLIEHPGHGKLHCWLRYGHAKVSGNEADGLLGCPGEVSCGDYG